MANDKNFVVKNGLTTQNISFVDNITTPNNTITVTMLTNDTLSFSGNTGQLFSVTDSMTGTIFAVNDISGVPSIEVDDDGTIRLAETAGNILVGTAVDDGINKLQINGSSSFNGAVVINESGADVDFRIESDTNTHAFFLDGANGNVGIKTSSPASALDVNGTVTITTGSLNYLPDTGDVIRFDGSAFIKRLTANGGARIGKDDCLVLGGGEAVGAIETNIVTSSELVHIGAESGIRFYSFPSNDTTWSNRKEMIYDDSGNLTVPGQLSANTISFGTHSDASSNTVTVATTSLTSLDTSAAATYRTIKYVVQITQGSSYQSSEVLITHNGTTAYMTEYGIIRTGSNLGTLSTDISGGNVRLLVTMVSATSATIKIQKTTIDV